MKSELEVSVAESCTFEGQEKGMSSRWWVWELAAFVGSA